MGEERQKGWEGVEKGQSEFNESMMEMAQCSPLLCVIDMS